MRALLEQTSEAWSFRLRCGRLPLAGLEELSGRLSDLESSGGAADTQDFRPILAVARAAEDVRRALGRAESPHLSRRREDLPRFEKLLERARKLFDADGTLRDEASPALSAVRTRLRRRRSEVARSLEKIVDQRREMLGDAVVVLRNDRYCLPVISSARSRIPGIVHDRSGSGQTVFVEPLEVIESNNELALLAAEERRELERLVAEFGRAVLSFASDLEGAVEALAQLDALEARVEFGELSQGRVVEISEDGEWTLAAARHPLLDPLLAPLRRRVLEETRPARPAVPLDLHLTREKRMLVVSGPNAGGKTVVLKTAGLFCLLAQAGFPLPAAAGTRIPVFRSVRTEIGDAQAILSDRSTFSSSMETLASILRTAEPSALALVDEIGGATDPEEGSALAVAWLEAYLARGGRAIVTTHLSAVKNFAAERADAVRAAMEFDERSGRPNYRLHPGLSGRSHALSVAREQGLPVPMIERAREILGDAWRRSEERESEAEAALERLRLLERELAAEKERARLEADGLAKERESLSAERARLLEEGLAGFESARRELTSRVEEQLERARQDATRAAGLSAAALVARAEAAVAPQPVIEEALDAERARSRDLSPGGHARLRGMKTKGTILSLNGETAWMEIGGKRVRVARSRLEPAPDRSGATPRRRSALSAAPEPITPPTREVNVIGQRLDEAIAEIEKKLDEALLSGAGRLRIVHGHGTGRLREGVREHFRAHPAVTGLRAAEPREGGNGATIVELM